MARNSQDGRGMAKIAREQCTRNIFNNRNMIGYNRSCIVAHQQYIQQRFFFEVNFISSPSLLISFSFLPFFYFKFQVDH